MQRTRKILLTTTSHIDGVPIEQYLGPVSAQLVIGTGLLTDILSSWTDFFGAHSGSYQKKLDQIQREALLQIEIKAARLGANAVLGLRVDHDEISGTGKSMLMVTAMGTAVRASKRQVTSSEASQGPARVSSEEVVMLIMKRNYLERELSDRLELSDDVWRFMIENKVHEIVPLLIKRHARLATNAPHDHTATKLVAQLDELLLSLPAEVSRQYLYDAIGEDLPFAARAVQVIKMGNLLDLQALDRLLSAEAIQVRRLALQTVAAHMPSYGLDDVPSLRALAQRLPDAFPSATKSMKNRTFGSPKEVWDCPCGKSVDGDSTRCPTCYRDDRGFGSNDINPEAAAQILNRRADVIVELSGNDI